MTSLVSVNNKINETQKPPLRWGIYLHFPFCRRKCRYCNFFSEDCDLNRIANWVESVSLELELYRDLLEKAGPPATLYIGGGSPNLLGSCHFSRLMERLHSRVDLTRLDEFTIEVNPESVGEELLTPLTAAGVNRVSVGVQSFNVAELQVLGRLHSVNQAHRTLELIHSHGLGLSIDLIYGIPGQTDISWEYSLSEALKYAADHISCYNLSYEEGTPLWEARRSGALQPVEPDLEWEMYHHVHQRLTDNGFRHYEISNWAKPGHEARHNWRYWRHQPYLGIGPGAHSFDGSRRWWNVRSVDAYCGRLSRRELPLEGSETLTERDRLTERIMLGLRTREGVRLAFLGFAAPVDPAVMTRKLDEWLGNDFLTKYAHIEGDCLKLSHQGWFVADTIIRTILINIEENQ